jgi:hypothetical protein
MSEAPRCPPLVVSAADASRSWDWTARPARFLAPASASRRIDRRQRQFFHQPAKHPVRDVDNHPTEACGTRLHENRAQLEMPQSGQKDGKLEIFFRWRQEISKNDILSPKRHAI